MNDAGIQGVEIPSDFLEIIEKYNFYMRLGLKTNQVEPNDIQEAWTLKREAFQQAMLEQVLTQQQFEQALELIQEAYNTLSDPRKRRRYDRRLFRAHRKTSAVVSPTPSDEFAMRYSLERVIHEGRRAKLWIALDQKISRKVLIKEIHPSLVRTEEQIQRFRDECSFYANSNATHLVKVLDYDETSFRVVMELLPEHMGDASTKLWAEGKDYTPREIREILRQCLRGLQVLHSRGWVHSRLSPSHILLDDHGNIKLSITPGLRESSIATVPTIDITHIAPEMLRPDIFGPVTPASDLYVLGFIILDLITRNRIIEGIDETSGEQSTDQERWYRWHASPFEALTTTAEWMHQIPEDLLVLLEKLTSKQPDKRPVDATAALRMFNDLEGSIGPSATTAENSITDVQATLDEFGAEHLGAPPALHDSQFEEYSQNTWQSIKQASKDWLNANPKRKWLAIGAVPCVMLLLFSFSAPKSTIEEKTPDQDVIAESEQLDSEDVESQSRFPEDGLHFEPVKVTQQETKKIEETKLVSANTARNVNIEVEGGASRIAVENQKPTLTNRHIWLLEPGEYTATIHYGKDQSLKHRFRVPEGEGPYSISIVPPPVPTTPKVVEVPKLKWQPRSFRADIAFDIVGVAPHDYTRVENLIDVSQRLIDFLNYGNQKSKPNLSVQAIDRNRDPRISLLLAIQAYREGKLADAEKLCNESIAVIERNHVPFVLPYQLLVHIYDSEEGRMRECLTVTAKSIFMLQQRYQETSEKDLKLLIAEQLWVFGKLSKHAEESSMKTTSAMMDSSLYLELLALNEQFEDNPFAQGIAEYESRMTRLRPAWYDISLQSSKYRESHSSTKKRSESDSWHGGRYPYSTASDSEHKRDTKLDYFAYPQPGRALREQLNRRALGMDHDLSFLVHRVRLTLPSPPDKTEVAQVVMYR